MQKQITAQQIVQEQKKEREKFIARVQKQEVFAREQPEAYRRRVQALAWLGYAYIFGVLILTVALIFGMVLFAIRVGSGAGVVRIIFFLVLFCLAILRSLWVKIPPPGGVLLERSDAPKLFEEIDRLSAKLDAIKIDNVLVDQDTNAAAAQVPRFGFFGPTQNYLLIGIPLLVSLSPDEFLSVIAHELGHFSGQHGRFGSWVYRLYQTWANLRANVRHSIGSFVLRKFFDWFEPTFAADTFALRRANEYQADQVSSSLVGADAAGSALMRIQFVGPLIQKYFWEPFEERPKWEPEPPQNALLELSECARSPVEPQFVREHLEGALSQKTTYDDVHPRLNDRLVAMGLDVQTHLDAYVESLSHALPETAADRFVGDKLEPLLQKVSGKVLAQIGANWSKAHREFQESRLEFEKLQAKAESGPLTQADSLRLATLAAGQRGPQEAIPLFVAHVELYPDDADAQFWYGSALLEVGDESGVAPLREAMRLRPDYSVAAIKQIGNFEHGRHNDQALEVLREEIAEAHTVQEMADREARMFELSNEFLPHDLPADLLDLAVSQFRTRTDVTQVFIVRKQLPSTPSQPRLCFIVIRKRKRGFESENADAEFTRKVAKEIDFPIQFMLYSPKQPKPWVKRLSKVPGALVFGG